MSAVSVGAFQIKCPDHELEDRTVFSEDERFFRAAVFDGHDGAACAEWLAQHFFDLQSSDMTQLFSAAETQLLKVFPKAGACAVAVVLDKVTNELRVGNVGDCAAVLDDVLLTTVHRAEDEAERIAAAGGWVSHDKRVFGILQPSRSLGDRDLKMRGIPPPPLNKREEKQLKRAGAADTRRPSGDASKVVIAVPAVATAAVPAEGGILVLGSDGLFDLLPHRSCMKLARGARQRGESAAQVAEALCRVARERKSRDDISAVVCFVSPAQAAPALATMEREELVISTQSAEEAAQSAKRKKNKNKKQKQKNRKAHEEAETLAPPPPQQAGVRAADPTVAKSPAEVKAAMLVVSSALFFYVLVMILQ